MPSPLELLARARRRVLIHRRGLAALLLGLAVWAALDGPGSAHPAEVDLWTARHDLDAGAVLGASDFRRTGFVAGSVPRAATRDLRTLVGRTLATPLGEGEVATTRMVLSNRRLSGYPGRAAIAVRIPDADAVGLLRSGDHVDLVASDPQQQTPPRRIARNAVVLMVPRPTGAGGGTEGGSGRLVVLAVPSDDVEEIAAAESALFLTVIWN
ncbi:MAG: RcpC/CpaB family pilus assembly protein [Marmoricola sp.]